MVDFILIWLSLDAIYRPRRSAVKSCLKAGEIVGWLVGWFGRRRWQARGGRRIGRRARGT